MTRVKQSARFSTWSTPSRTAATDKAGNRRVASRQLQFVETDATGATRNAGYAPYLDYRPATPEERTSLAATLESQAWLKEDLESVVVGHAIANLVPIHLGEVRNRRGRSEKRRVGKECRSRW